MGYKKASDVIPKGLLLAIQEYVDGEYLYIPRKKENIRQWGENTQNRQRLRARNREIAAKRRAGCPVASLAEQYYLSVQAVYKILAAANCD